MNARTFALAGLVSAALVLGASCGRTLFFTHPQRCIFDTDCDAGLRCVNQECIDLVFPDGGPKHGNKRFGEPCDAGLECDSEVCVGAPRGRICTRACDAGDAGCPSSFACKKVPDPENPSAQRLVSLCTIPQPTLCQPCELLPRDGGVDGGADGGGDLGCGASGGDLCFSSGSGTFCGRDCEYTGCPDGYDCVDGQDFRGPHKQCIPHGRSCNCTVDNVGLAISCRIANTFGACAGKRLCQTDGGFTDCDAPQAAQETCNGLDDDCNGAIDDFTPPECTKTVGALTCRGPQICMGTAGLVCAAKDPTAEVCNYMDDDCNGLIDEPFVDLQGRYVTLAHCGVCNNNCASIAHATSTTCAVTATGTPRCRVLACAAGYFPYDDGRMCLALPDTLCQPCQADADCVGPGSRCLTIDGARVCGRDCSATSPYTTACPGGYACSTVAVDAGVTGQQCTPVTGTCTCRTSTLGAMRSCSVDTCRGFATCAAGGSGPSWSVCDVNSFNPEICDGRDNNCNGQIDEGFKNQATGKYDTSQNCGFCNNDCTKYWSPTLQHTTGLCDTAPALPACTMGACLTEVVGGVTYEWVNVNADTSDGCECRRVQGNLTTDLPDRAPSTGVGPSWVDENCDGIDGVVGDAIFVSATAAAGGNGTRTAPLQTVTAGVAAMQAQGKRYVLVAQGIYRENVRLFDGAQIFGGYSSDFLKRDPLIHTSFIEGVVPTASAIAAIDIENAGNGATETVVAGFTINGVDISSATPPGQPGTASIGVYLRDSGPRVVLMTNDISAGRGGQGGRGGTGTQGFGRQSSAALNGQVGADSEFFSSGVCGMSRSGGLPGSNPQCAAGNAAAGGNVICPVYTWAGNQGQQQMYVAPPPTSRNGRGGFDWSYDTLSGFGCSHVTESGFPTAIQAHDGDDGKPGADGSGGLGGAGAPAVARHGSFSGGRWVTSPSGAAAGIGGFTAEGGGGGGAGGGVAKFTSGCQGWEIGATGGGGGAGACGGTGGAAGGAGGGSIAVLIAYSLPTTFGGLPAIRGNRIQRGLGGDGGNGGFGGAGGLGGSGGFGGTANRWSSSYGGKGGEGGNGGPGGGGGGGAGGPSFGFLGFNAPLSSLSTLNTLLTPATTNTGGQGGAGGSSPGAMSSTGTPGARGAFADLLSLSACAPGCATGTTCDGNGVCVPN